MSHEDYRGWRVSYNERQPVTGRWRAIRYGVDCCASTLEQLKQMIDRRIERYSSSGGA